MGKYCAIANAVTNCTDNCKQCLEEEARKEELKMADHYKITLAIYPIADCGEDCTKGDPLEISYEGADISELKKYINDTILNAMRAFNANDGLTRIEYTIEENGEYVDHEEGYYNIDLANNTSEFIID